MIPGAPGEPLQPMIIGQVAGVGIDLVEIAEIGRSIAIFGNRFLSRIYTPNEQFECGKQVDKLASYFAAKEATIKALRLPPTVPTPPREIEIRGTKAQLAPGRGVYSCGGTSFAVRLHGGLAHWTESAGLTPSSVALSRTSNFAMAVVITMTTGGGSTG